MALQLHASGQGHGHVAPAHVVAALGGLALLSASFILSRLFQPGQQQPKRRGSVDSDRLASSQRGRRRASEDDASSSGASSSSDGEQVNDDLSALFRVAEVAPHVSTSFETVPRRRGRRTVNLFLRTLEPPQARGVILLLHGLNGHSGHGSNLWTAALLANNGFIVRAVDHEGHGRSADSSRRVFFRNVDAMAADVADILRDSARKRPDLPHFIMGISFGGCLALKSTLALSPEERKLLVAGLILQCPFIQPAQESTPGPLVRAAAHALSAIAPHLAIAGANRGRGANPAIQKKVAGLMMADPLCYKGKLRIGTALALVAASESLRKRLGEVDVPFLVQHGDADKVVAVEGSRRLFRQAASADKQIKIYEGASHNLMHELPDTMEAIRGDFLAWLDERMAAAGRASSSSDGASDAVPGALAALGASRGAAAAAANAASLLLRRATSSVPPETLAIAAAAIAALRTATSVAPTQGSSSSSTSSGGSSSVWDRASPKKAGFEKHHQQQQPFAEGATGAEEQEAALKKLGPEPGLSGWMLELRRTSSGVSAATLLAHAALMAEGHGRRSRLSRA